MKELRDIVRDHVDQCERMATEPADGFLFIYPMQGPVEVVEAWKIDRAHFSRDNWDGYISVRTGRITRY